MKTQRSNSQTLSFLLFGSLFSLNALAQVPGVPNQNAGNHPWTNNGHHGNSGNNGNDSSYNSGNNGNGLIPTPNNETGGGENTPPATTNNKNATGMLNVVVGEFYSLNLSNENAFISLDGEAKFANGSASNAITMTVFSSKQYAVKAQVSSANFNGVADNTTVNTNNIDLIVEKLTGSQAATASARTDKSLKHAASEQIASSALPTKSDIYSLTYSIPAKNTAAFLDQYGKTITTQITYTLFPL